jgi:ADP-ribose pyrophosphatase YjhB (NUDIX family)
MNTLIPTAGIKGKESKLNMPIPVTPLVAVDTFHLNQNHQVCLIRRKDNGLWAMPGGYHDLGETPQRCAEREVFEETGLRIKPKALLGVFSSLCYADPSEVNRGREVCHLLFSAELLGGTERLSEETMEVAWFSEDNLPSLSSGHSERLRVGFSFIRNLGFVPYFE